MKLKYLLVTFFIFLSAIPIFVSLQFFNTYTSSQYRAQIEEKLSALSLIAKKRVLAVVDRIKDNTTLINSRTQMRLSLRQWSHTREPQHLEKINRIIRDASRGMKNLENISIYDVSGKMVTAINNSSFGQQLIKIPKKEEGSLVQLKFHEDDHVVSSTSPLILENTTLGYIRIDFSADFLIDLVNDRTGLGVSGEWLIAIRNDNGDALFAVPLKYDEYAAFRRTIAKNRLDVPITQALLGNELVMRNAPDYIETPVLASTRYIPDLDWGLVAKISESEVNDIIANTNQILIWLEFAIIVLAVLVGITLSFYISKPLEKLKENTKKVAHGDFDIETVKKGWKEVVELSLSFNTMAKSLKDLNENLNKKVIERTKELNEANRKLKKIAIKDPLTDLYNRRFLHERLTYEFNRAKRYHTSLIVAMLDLDHFKRINDTWGHAAGDEVLVKVSDYFVQALRESDTIGRMGGEEFCIIFPNISEDEVMSAVERLRLGVADLQFQFEGQPLQVTCSFGVTIYTESVENPDEIIKQADQALYKAKQAGRNRVVRHQGAKVYGIKSVE